MKDTEGVDSCLAWEVGAVLKSAVERSAGPDANIRISKKTISEFEILTVI